MNKGGPAPRRRDSAAIQSTFHKKYLRACDEKRVLRPVPGVVEHLREGFIDTSADRFTVPQWEALNEALKSDTTLSRLRLTCTATGKKEKRKRTKKFGDKENITARLYVAESTASDLAIYDRQLMKLFCSSLFSSLSASSKITTLQLEGIRFTVDSLKLLGKGIKQNHSLCYFSLRGCHIGEAGLDALLPGLTSSGMEIICLRDCNLSDRAGKMLAQVIKFHATQRNDMIWQASLRGGNHTPPPSPGKHVKASSSTPGGLWRLDIAHNNLESDAAVELSQALGQDEWITEINLAGNRIGRDGIDALVQLVLDSQTITAMDIHLNKGTRGNDLKTVAQHTATISALIEKRGGDVRPRFAGFPEDEIEMTPEQRLELASSVVVESSDLVETAAVPQAESRPSASRPKTKQKAQVPPRSAVATHSKPKSRQVHHRTDRQRPKQPPPSKRAAEPPGPAQPKQKRDELPPPPPPDAMELAQHEGLEEIVAELLELRKLKMEVAAVRKAQHSAERRAEKAEKQTERVKKELATAVSEIDTLKTELELVSQRKTAVIVPSEQTPIKSPWSQASLQSSKKAQVVAAAQAHVQAARDQESETLQLLEQSLASIGDRLVDLEKRTKHSH